MKKIIRLTESDLHRIVKESVSRVLKEAKNWTDPDIYDGNLHTFTVDVYTKSDGKFGYAVEAASEEEIDMALRNRFPDLLNWNHPRRND